MSDPTVITKDADPALIATSTPILDLTATNVSSAVTQPQKVEEHKPTAAEQALEKAVTELSFASRLFGDVASAIDVVLAHIETTKPVTVPATNSETPTVDSLSEREQKILTLLQQNTGEFVSNRKLNKFATNGRNVDLSTHISRIRELGLTIESAQTARRNGEKIDKSVTGYRLITAKQLLMRRATAQLRKIVIEIFSGG